MHKRRIIVDAVLILIACVFTGFSLMTGAAPMGGLVQHGDITIGSDQSKGIDTLVTQTSQKGIINWQSFGIGQGEHTHFAQPNASAVTLNRVTGGNISEILGQLTATGRILLINPSGILFGPNARVDVAGLIASTAAITDSDFLNGAYIFNQGPNNQARIINQGMISAREGGMIALVAPGVENSGVITANLGKVILASAPAGSSYTIDLYGDGLLQFALPSAVTENIKDAIVQSGDIRADGGTVLLSVNTAKGVVDRTINMSGIIEANTVVNRRGQIILTGGNGAIAEVSGQLKARGNRSGEKGGSVRVLTSKVALTDGAVVDVSGQAGGGEALIGGDYKGSGGLPTAEMTYVAPGAKILANAEEMGDGGKIIVWSNTTTGFYGTAEAKGGPLGGNGGFVETSSANWLDVSGARINASAPLGEVGTWLLDPYDITIQSIPGVYPTSLPPAPWLPGQGWVGGTWVPPGTSTVSRQDILANLGGANVVIDTGLGGGGDVGNITVNAPIYYTGSASSLTLIADNDITINQVIYGNLALYLNAGGNIYINRNLGVGGPLSSVDMTAPGGITFGAVRVYTTGTQTYNSPITLGSGAIRLYSWYAPGGDIIFNGAINGGYDLYVSAGDWVRFNGRVGYTDPLNYLYVSSGNGIIVNTDYVLTSGSQEYTAYSTSPMTLMTPPPAATTFKSQTGNINLGFISNSYGKNLILDTSEGSGQVIIESKIGGLQGEYPLQSVTIHSPAGIVFYGGYAIPAIYTIETQTYDYPITLVGPGIARMSTLAGTGDIIINNTIMGTTIVQIYSGGEVVFNDLVGDSSDPLRSLLVTAIDGINLKGGGVATLGDQTYGSAMTLGADTIFTALAGGNIAFNSTLDSDSTSRTLFVNTAGAATFKGTVGGRAPLSSLVVNASSGINLNGMGTPPANSITTIGSQTYNGPVMLGANNSLITTGGGDIDFWGSINSANHYDLTLDTKGIGDIWFGGRVGSEANRIGTMNILNARNVTVNDVPIYVQHFNQYAGSGATNFGNDSLYVLGPGGTTIITDRVYGHIVLSYAPLYLGVNYTYPAFPDPDYPDYRYAFFGTIAGDYGIDNIVLLHDIFPDTQFFNGIDLFRSSPSIEAAGIESIVPSFAIITEQAGLSEENIHEVGISYVSPAVELFAEQELTTDFLLLTSPSFECEQSSEVNY